MVEVRDGKKKEQSGLFAYNSVIHLAFLNKHQHALLAYYAVAYNWTDKKASYHSQALICRTIDMPPATYQTTRKELEKLGWISVEIRYKNSAATHKSVFVTVHCGKDDKSRATKIQAARVRQAKKAQTKDELWEEAQGFEFRGGRTPDEEKKFRDSIAHFEKVEEHLAKQSKFKMPRVPLRSQSQQVQFETQNK